MIQKYLGQDILKDNIILTKQIQEKTKKIDDQVLIDQSKFLIRLI